MRYRSSTVSLALAVLAVLGLAIPVTAAKEVPFKGSFQAVETSEVQFPTVFVEASGLGHATKLGRFTMNYESVINLPTLTGIGSAHFIAANGDSLVTEVHGVASPTEDPDFLFIVEAHTITGGTGRFACATGSFTLERLLDTVTGATSGSFEGTISSAGASQH
jgi:hypothetical protein